MATSLKGKSVEARENGSDILGEFLDQGICMSLCLCIVELQALSLCSHR